MLTVSGDELCGLLPTLLQAADYHLHTVGYPAFPAICLLIVHTESSSLPLSPSPVCFQQSLPLHCALVFSSLFTIQFGFFVGGVSLPREIRWFIPGVAWGILSDVWCSPVWSANHLPSRFGASGWWWQQPTCSLSVMCHGEAFHRLGAQDVKVSTLLCASSLPSIAPASQQSP
jgi:hypothetical protein